jgi:hypothetical protein
MPKFMLRPWKFYNPGPSCLFEAVAGSIFRSRSRSFREGDSTVVFDQKGRIVKILVGEIVNAKRRNFFGSRKLFRRRRNRFFDSAEFFRRGNEGIRLRFAGSFSGVLTEAPLAAAVPFIRFRSCRISNFRRFLKPIKNVENKNLAPYFIVFVTRIDSLKLECFSLISISLNQ